VEAVPRGPKGTASPPPPWRSDRQQDPWVHLTMCQNEGISPLSRALGGHRLIKPWQLVRVVVRSQAETSREARPFGGRVLAPYPPEDILHGPIRWVQCRARRSGRRRHQPPVLGDDRRSATATPGGRGRGVRRRRVTGAGLPVPRRGDAVCATATTTRSRGLTDTSTWAMAGHCPRSPRHRVPPSRRTCAGRAAGCRAPQRKAVPRRTGSRACATSRSPSRSSTVFVRSELAGEGRTRRGRDRADAGGRSSALQ